MHHERGIVVKIRTFASGAVVTAMFAVVSCSFGPDAYNGPPVCPGDPPPDGVQVNDPDCHDYSMLDSGTGDAAGGSAAGSAGAPGAAGASAAGSGA
jgi:hypothetical protein